MTRSRNVRTLSSHSDPNNCSGGPVFGLMAIFWATGRGIEVVKPIARPSIGGMAVSLVTLFTVPCLFSAIAEPKWQRAQHLMNSEFAS